MRLRLFFGTKVRVCRFSDGLGILLAYPKVVYARLLASITSLNLANEKQLQPTTDNEVELWLLPFAHRVTVRPGSRLNLVVVSGRAVVD